MAYLSCVKGVAIREIVAYDLSTSLRMEIVYRTLTKLESFYENRLHPEAIIHSDQGFYYTHPEYESRVKEMGILQSVSRRGNYLDNAPLDPFFGHVKDVVRYKKATSLAELKHLIDDYMDRYNNTRKQWTFKKMILLLTEVIH